MSVLVSCQDLAKSYYARPLFEGLTLGVMEGDRIGVIGPNGAGKSTLLRLIAGLEEADGGRISLRRGVRVVHVAQSHVFPAGKSCRALVAEGAAQRGVTADEADAEAGVILGQIGFPDPEAHATTLSGGWRKRLQIAVALAQHPDLLLLDEPTNHLDLEGIVWLEGLLSDASFAWMMVSHDRYMLEKAARKVAEVSRVYPNGIFVSDGRYNDFLTRRADWLNQQARLEETLANKAKREVEWLRRGPQARTTKSKHRIEEAHALIGELGELRQRLRTGETKLDFSASGRKTRRLVVAEGVAKELGDRTITKALDLVLAPGLRIGILGGNGTGKTTILKMLAKVLPPDAGRIDHAEDLQVVYFDQNRESLDPAKTLKQTLCPYGDAVIFRGRSTHIVTWAKRFQFTAEQLEIPVGELSGGEQARALIAQLMLVPADVLLLDEPTNDLDIPTLEVLEETLDDFPGAVALVTHDRYLMGEVCNVVLGLDGQGGAQLYGDYEQWERAMKERAAGAAKAQRAAASKADAAPKAEPDKPKRLSYMEQREYDRMEGEILEAETDLDEKRAAAEDPAIASQSGKLQAAFAALQAAQERVEKLYARWAELEAKTR